MRRNREWTIRCLTAAALLAWPGSGRGQRIGLFLDEAATQCSGVLAPFDPCKAIYVYGFLPADVPIGGATFSLQRSPGVVLCQQTIRFPRDLVFEAQGDLARVQNIDLKFRDCRTGPDPLLLATFWVTGGLVTGNDLLLRLVGVAQDSILSLTPQLKICDPGNPDNELGRISAPSVDLIFNCTRPNCDCTTAVETTTWSALKNLYLER